MASTPDFTVVIPARNAESTIANQIHALNAQYDGTFEVILVDNASTDRTAEEARAAATSMPLTILHEPRIGTNTARNTGIKHSASERILLCDSDDIVSQGWVARLGHRLESGVWVAGCIDFELLNSPHTRILRRRSASFVDAGFVGTWGCNCGFMKSDWLAVGGFDERLHACGDETEFFQRLSDAGVRGVAVPDAVVHYRQRPGWRNLLRDEFRDGVAHERMVNLALSGRWIARRHPLDLAARLLAHLLILPFIFWSVPRRARHLSGMAYHLGRLSGVRLRGRR